MRNQITNPYLPSYEYVPDGEPKVFNDRLYVFGSHDRFDGEFFCLNDYVCWSAPVKDLSNWKFEGYIYFKEQDPLVKDGKKSEFTHSKKLSMFAPDVVQGRDGRFYLYYGLDFVNQTSVAVSNSPIGPYEFHGVVRHADGTIFGQKEGDPFQFDPAVLVDGKSVWFYTSFSPKQELIDKLGKEHNIKLSANGSYVVELESDMLTVTSKVKSLIPGWGNSKGTSFEGHEFYEASSIRKFDGKYYFVYSTVESHELAYAFSDKPDRDFIFGGVLHSNGNIGYQGNFKATNYWGNNHGSIELVDGKYYIFGHRQTNQTEFSRQGVAELIHMDNTGQFEMVEMTSLGLNNKPLVGGQVYSAGIACELWSSKGAIKSPTVTELKLNNAHPYITQIGNDRDSNPYQYIKNLKKGSTVGFKYFDFKKSSELKVKLRGSNGTVRVYTELNTEPVAVFTVNGTFLWEEHSAKFTDEINGIFPLYFVFDSEEAIDFLCFEFN